MIEFTVAPTTSGGRSPSAVVSVYTVELSRPEIYDDADRRDTLLREVTEAQAQLERAFEEWTKVQHELEGLGKEDRG